MTENVYKKLIRTLLEQVEDPVLLRQIYIFLLYFLS